MSDDRPRIDPMSEDEWQETPEMEEEAFFPVDDMQNWEDESGLEGSFETERDDLDAAYYEPPEPPITDADFVQEEPPGGGGDWFKENWWRIAIIVVLVVIILVLMVRACRGGNTRATPTPMPTEIFQGLPTFTPTSMPVVVGTVQSGEALPPAGSPLTTPQAPAVAPTTPPTPEPLPTQAPANADQFTIGQIVIVTGTGVERLALREGPGRKYAILRTIKDGVKLTVIGGPKEADGFVWWQLRTPKGYEGWAVQDYLRPRQ